MMSKVARGGFVLLVLIALYTSAIFADLGSTTEPMVKSILVVIFDGDISFEKLIDQ